MVYILRGMTRRVVCGAPVVGAAHPGEGWGCGEFQPFRPTNVANRLALPFYPARAVQRQFRPAVPQRRLLLGSCGALRSRSRRAVKLSHISSTHRIQAYYLFKKGAGVNDRDSLTDMSILHFACKSGARGVGSDVSAHAGRRTASCRSHPRDVVGRAV